FYILHKPFKLIRWFMSHFKFYSAVVYVALQVLLCRILSKINKVIKKNRFNHYLPAKEFASNKDFVNSLSEATLSRFETIFKEVNKNLK
ncbi:hypothetical protein, partial [Acinetobacter pittii]